MCLEGASASRTSTSGGPSTRSSLALKLTTKDLHLLLADHSTKSRSLDSKAKEYSLLAARDATALGLYREAEQHYRRVVSMEQPSFVEEEVGKLSQLKLLDSALSWG